MVTYHEEFQPIMSHDPSFTRPCNATDYIFYVSFCTIVMGNKHGKKVTYYEGLRFIKSHNDLNSWSPEFTWQIDELIAEFAVDLEPPT